MFLCVCVVSICSCTYCQTDDVSLICWCFFYLHLFSDVAVRSALSATVVDTFLCICPIKRDSLRKRIHSTHKLSEMQLSVCAFQVCVRTENSTKLI